MQCQQGCVGTEATASFSSGILCLGQASASNALEPRTSCAHTSPTRQPLHKIFICIAWIGCYPTPNGCARARQPIYTSRDSFNLSASFAPGSKISTRRTSNRDWIVTLSPLDIHDRRYDLSVWNRSIAVRTGALFFAKRHGSNVIQGTKENKTERSHGSFCPVFFTIFPCSCIIRITIARDPRRKGVPALSVKRWRLNVI